MRRLLAALIAALIIASPAAAAPPAASGAISVDPSSNLVFGGELVLVSTTDLPNQGFAYTSVVCLQGVGNVVYQWSQRLGTSPQTYPLVDQEGQGLEWPGGAADCEAWLLYRVQHGNNITLTLLDTVAFHVEG